MTNCKLCNSETIPVENIPGTLYQHRVCKNCKQAYFVPDKSSFLGEIEFCGNPKDHIKDYVVKDKAVST